MNRRELKAVRLVNQHRTKIVYRNPDVLYGIVWGDHGIYTVDINPERERCDCAHWGRCSHIIALKLEGKQDGTTRISRNRGTRRVETGDNLGVHVERATART